VKILLDACVWGGALAKLRSEGHDVEWIGALPEDPGDEEVISRACAEGRVLVTLDKDFGEMAVVRGVPHCGIIRLVDVAASRQAEICLLALKRYEADLNRGALITVSSGRTRIRLP
jgi:predicted nuclease of predicted toxin-antitoxin system